MRLDQFLQQKFNLESRHQAQRLILEGVVKVNTKTVDKNSYDVDETDNIEIIDLSILKYVSRGGLKLAAALTHTNLSVKNFICLDIGQSTGGFTDCLLQAGAKQVIGVEVGHGQLHEGLRGHPQITTYEKTHILEVVPEDLKNPALDLIVIDLSFISLTKVLGKVSQLSQPTTKMLALVKPQFELGAAALNKSGLVKDINDYELVEARIRGQVTAAGFQVIDYFQAFPKGGDGNQEFFVFASKTIF